MKTSLHPPLRRGAVVEFICADPDLPRVNPRPRGSLAGGVIELANCRTFADAVAVFIKAGRSKTEAIRLAIDRAPDLHAAYRITGGPL